MRHYSLFIAVLGLLLTTISCQKNDYTSYLPSWKGFEFKSNEQVVNPRTGIHAGDVITVTALQDQKGRLINATTYNWEVKAQIPNENGVYVDSVFYTLSVHTNYDGTSNADPFIKFTIPPTATGSGKVSFNASYALSGQGVQISDGGDYSKSPNISGSIHSTSSSMYGAAKGSVNFTIRER